jgi:uncharacterized protein YaaN involved in tellurite resistance
MTILLTETEKELAKERDGLAAQLAQVSGDLVRANNENWRLRRDNEDMARALTATHETLGHMGAIEAELDAARSALDEVTRERDAATKALELAEAHAKGMTGRYVDLDRRHEALLAGHLRKRLEPSDDETVRVYERTARIRAEHKAIAELTAENARLRQALATADELGDEAVDSCLKLTNMLYAAQVERDEARALLKDALEERPVGALFDTLVDELDELVKTAMPMVTVESVIEEWPSQDEITVRGLPAIRAFDVRALLTEALKDGDE